MQAVAKTKEEVNLFRGALIDGEVYEIERGDATLKIRRNSKGHVIVSCFLGSLDFSWTFRVKSPEDLKKLLANPREPQEILTE